jgi:predicted ATPase
MRDPAKGYVKELLVKPPPECRDEHPFTIPAIRAIKHLRLDPGVTILVGENGSGKSTLLEGIAEAYGFNPEGGSLNFHFTTRAAPNPLADAMTLVKNPRRARDGFFLRAESFFNVATEIEHLDEDPLGGPPIGPAYSQIALHEQSHGESFVALLVNRFHGNGFYVLDEPEAALSPTRQMAVLVRIHDLVRANSQFVIATHSPIILAYPGATIYSLSETGIAPVRYEETEHVVVTRAFMNNQAEMLRTLMGDGRG